MPAAASSMLPALAPILFFIFSAHAAAIPGFRFVVPAGSPPLKGSEGGSPSAGTNCTSRGGHFVPEVALVQDGEADTAGDEPGNDADGEEQDLPALPRHTNCILLV